MALDKLTELVLSYKETKNEVVIPEILRLSEGLIWGVFKYYKISNFPAPIQEDIAADCRSFVLAKTMEAFTPDKQAKFSTFYTWRLKSHIRAKRGFYLRRKELGRTVPFDMDSRDSEASHRGHGGPYFAETLTNPNYSYRALGQFKKRIAELFDM